MTASLESKIVVLSCNWNGWSCVESATSLGTSYPSSVKVIRVSCLSRIHAGLMLKAFEFGADGVILLGCGPDSCHFGSDGSQINAELEKAHSILGLLGINKERLTLIQLPAFEGQEFVTRLTQFMDGIEQKRLFPEQIIKNQIDLRT